MYTTAQQARQDHFLPDRRSKIKNEVCMPILAILVLLLAQGIPALGLPASGIRVAAMALQDASQDRVSASMVSITQTDAAGRYRLEDIPPGRYYIVAGRVDLPTFYPGVLEMTAAREILITPDSSLQVWILR
jgi:hypothetical protein